MGPCRRLALWMLAPVRALNHLRPPNLDRDSALSAGKAMPKPTETLPGTRPATFHLFLQLPPELRCRVWHFYLPDSQIVRVNTNHPQVFSSENHPAYPPEVCTLRLVNREARDEMARLFLVLNFPLRKSTYHHSGFEISTQMCRTGGQSCSTSSVSASAPRQSRWVSRGKQCLNLEKDSLYFDRTALRKLDAEYGLDFVPVMIFALGKVQFLALSMNCWKKYKSKWLRILRNLSALKEVVFVWEKIIRAQTPTPYVEFGFGYCTFVKLSEVKQPDYMDSSLVFEHRILNDLKNVKELWPGWVMPRIAFRGIRFFHSNQKLQRMYDFLWLSERDGNLNETVIDSI